MIAGNKAAMEKSSSDDDVQSMEISLNPLSAHNRAPPQLQQKVARIQSVMKKLRDVPDSTEGLTAVVMEAMDLGVKSGGVETGAVRVESPMTEPSRTLSVPHPQPARLFPEPALVAGSKGSATATDSDSYNTAASDGAISSDTFHSAGSGKGAARRASSPGARDMKEMGQSMEMKELIEIRVLTHKRESWSNISKTRGQQRKLGGSRTWKALMRWQLW